MARVGVKSNILANLWERVKYSQFFEGVRNMFSFMTNNEPVVGKLGEGAVSGIEMTDSEIADTLKECGIKELMKKIEAEEKVKQPEVEPEDGRGKLMSSLRPTSSGGNNAGASNTNKSKPDLSEDRGTENSEPVHDKE